MNSLRKNYVPSTVTFKLTHSDIPLRGSMDLNEFQTRKQMIDVLLAEQGWDVQDPSKVVIEVDTKQSDFKHNIYKQVDDTLTNDLESRYVDYLLLDEHGQAIAVIEAKRTTKDPRIIAQEQASQYADDIKGQLGKDVFIFLTNGYDIWFWDRKRYPPRQIKGFFTRSDLERMRIQRENLKPLSSFKVNTGIVDYTQSIENVKRVLEHLEKGHRKALLVMATGTGKTRVAMAIIDVLMQAGWAERILFLADRKELRDQAWDDGYLEYFPEESKLKILCGEYNKESRLYVSTIQTFMEIYNQKDKNGQYLISPGEFDVVISDESHRSIYNKWRDVFTYLDAIQIGLTATPAEFIERNTFRFFECTEGHPTALYDYEKAVKDEVLVDFKKHIFGSQTHFQIEGIKKSDLTQDDKDDLLRQGVDEDDVNFEGTDIEKKIVITGTNEAIVREFMENCVMDISGNLPAKTIFFAVTKKHAKRLIEAFDKLYPEYKGTLAQVITSEDSRAKALIKNFKKVNLPRIAISVDMLDTGVNVPEICNLVFAKPVLSKIKFWQMIGRGTRANNACKHKEWLPNGKKEYFKIFDFWKNFEYFEMNPAGDESTSPEAITTRTFLTRLKQMQALSQAGDRAQLEKVKERILADIKTLPKDSVSIKEKAQEIAKALSPNFWDNVGIKPYDFLKEKIAPLMRFQPEVDLKKASFVYKTEKLGLALLEGNDKEVERAKKGIVDDLNCLPLSLDKVKEKNDALTKCVSSKFWSDISYEDSRTLITEFVDLMRYKSEEPPIQIVFDKDDFIQQTKLIQFGPDNKEEYVEVYRDKVERKVKELASKDPTISKIAKNEVITEEDLSKLESTLYSPELFISEDNLRKVYDKSKGTLVQFIKKILGLYKFPEPSEKIKEAFHTYMIENNKQYSADQLNFIRTIESVFLKKRHLEMDDLWDAPFTNFGTQAPEPMFKKEELKEFVKICEELEKELFGAEA